MTRATGAGGSGRGLGSRWGRALGLPWLLTLAIAAPAGGAIGIGGPPPKPFVLGPQVPCPPGTQIIFYRPDPTVPVVWHGVAYNPKTGKSASTGTFNSEIQGTDWVLNEIIGLCDELESGTSTAHARQLIPVGSEPSHAIVADFNSDGLADVAIVNQGSNTVTVALGTPSGLVGPTASFPTGAGPVRIAVGDFNNDGTLDIVTANIGTGLAGNLSLLLGNGNGTFQAPIAIAAGALPIDLAVGRFNGDNNLDLAVADSAGNAVVVLIGNGNGTFQSPVTLPTGAPFTASIITGDLNGDGKVDLITNGAAFLGKGDGTFQPAVNFGAGAAPSLVRSGDFNRDGKLDVVTASVSGNVVSVHLGNGDGSFQAPKHYVVGAGPNEVNVVDRDGAGTLDLVVSYGSDDHVTVLPGRGDGTFESARAYQTAANISGGAFAVAVADFTGDGVPDVVTTDAALLPGQALGRFGAAVPLPGLSGSGVVAADWNVDNKMDLAIVGASTGSPGQLKIALGNGNGTFAAPTSLPLPAGFSPFPLVRFPLVVDLNHDTKPDLVVANPGANSISVFVNTGGGSFSTPPDVPVGKSPTWLAAGDFNNDNTLDLVVVNHGDFGAGNGSIAVLLGDGAGGFQAGQVLRSGIEPDSVAVADVDGDGKLDVVAVVQSPAFTWNLNVFRGNGDGTFGGAVGVPIGEDLVTGVRVADFDLDGHPDVIASVDGTKIALLRNRGDGTFETPVVFDAGGGLAVAADVNRDGRPDLIVATSLGLVNVLLDAMPVAAPGTVASILPASRAVQVGGTPATVFATVINPSGAPFTRCDITPIATLPATFLFQTTDPATNAPTGTLNAPVSIGAGQLQTFLLAFTPQAPFPAIDVQFAFACDGVIPAAPIAGVNTLTLSARGGPGPDLIALAASATPGRLILFGAGAFAVATANVGTGADVTVSADTGGAVLPLVLAWCQTDPGSGGCLGPATSGPLPVFVGAGATPTFAIFATATGSIAFDPTLNRIFFRVRDQAGQVIGATSLAVDGGP